MESYIENVSSDTDDSINNLSMSPLERKLKFYILLILQTPAFCCTIFILYHFNWSRLQTQIYGILLIFNGLIITVELPFTLYFLYQGMISTKNGCTGWITLNYSLSLLSIILMAWTSIERYLFIYYERFMIRHHILLHYIPIGCIIIYCPLFYIGVVVLYTCQPVYNVNLYLCGGACYQLESALGLIDWMGNGIAMVMITFIVNVILILRHLIQRHRMRRAVITADGRSQWRRSIKLSMQLLAITMPYMIAWIPYSTIVLIQIFANTEQLAYLLTTYFVYLPYLQALLLPYLCISFIPEIQRKMLAVFKIECRWQNRVEPMEYNQRKIIFRPKLPNHH